jgi:hypothetical protein
LQFQIRARILRGKIRKSGAPDTIRTCGLYLRRATVTLSPQKCCSASEPRQFPNAKIGRPLCQIGAGVMSQSETATSFKRIATQSLDEDRGMCGSTFGHERASPFEMERAGSGTGFATVDDPLQQRREFTKPHRCKLRLNAHTVHDGGNVQQSWDVTDDTGLVGRNDDPYVRVSLTPVSWKHFGRVADALGQHKPIEMGCMSDEQPQTLPKRLVDFVVEDIRHRGTEYPPSFARGQRDPIPLDWLTPVSVMEIAARRPRAPMGATKPSGIEHHRIASLAQRTDLRAPPPGIEGVTISIFVTLPIVFHLRVGL